MVGGAKPRPCLCERPRKGAPRKRTPTGRRHPPASAATQIAVVDCLRERLDAEVARSGHRARDQAPPRPRLGRGSSSAPASCAGCVTRRQRWSSSAPRAGYGKTILLAQYAAVADRPFAWLSLDAADADPVLLALELATAIDRVSIVDARVFSSLSTPAPAMRRVVLPRARQQPRFRGGGSRPGRPSPARGFPGAWGSSPSSASTSLPGAQLLVASRDTSALPLGSLRVSGRLLELGWRDLALNRSEAEGLMRAAGAWLAEGDL